MHSSLPVFTSSCTVSVKVLANLQANYVQSRRVHKPDVFALLVATHLSLLYHHMQVHFLHTRYFSSMSSITISILDIINERVLPLSAKGYEVCTRLNWCVSP